MIRTFNRQRKLSMIIFTLEFSLLVKSAGHERNNRGCKIIIVHTMVANHPHYESWWSLPCVRHWITAVQKRSPPFLPPKAKDALQMRSCKSGAIIHFLLSRNYKIVFFLATIFYKSSILSTFKFCDRFIISSSRAFSFIKNQTTAFLRESSRSLTTITSLAQKKYTKKYQLKYKSKEMFWTPFKFSSNYFSITIQALSPTPFQMSITPVDCARLSSRPPWPLSPDDDPSIQPPLQLTVVSLTLSKRGTTKTKLSSFISNNLTTYSVLQQKCVSRPGEQNVSFIRNKLNFEYYLIASARFMVWLVDTRTM